MAAQSVKARVVFKKTNERHVMDVLLKVADFLLVVALAVVVGRAWGFRVAGELAESNAQTAYEIGLEHGLYQGTEYTLEALDSLGGEMVERQRMNARQQ